MFCSSWLRLGRIISASGALPSVQEGDLCLFRFAGDEKKPHYQLENYVVFTATKVEIVEIGPPNNSRKEVQITPDVVPLLVRFTRIRFAFFQAYGGDGTDNACDMVVYKRGKYETQREQGRLYIWI